MSRAGVILISLFGLLLLPTAGKAGAAEEGVKSSEQCIVRGARRLAECYRLQLPLDYADENGEKIEIHVAVLEARGANTMPDPIVIFAGGPGQAAGELGSLVETALRDAKRKRDVVLMDARGTGRSTPLQCEVPEDQTQFTDEVLVSSLEDCRAAIDFDVRHINLETIVQDMDRVRAHLGYETLNLWGGSYGTRVVSHYLRRFPQHVRSAIVDGVLPPDAKLFATAGRSAERAKMKLVDDCMARPECQARFPDLDAQIDALVASAKNGELVYDGLDPFTGEPLVFEFTDRMLIESIRSVMYSANASVGLPIAIEAASNGNLEPLIAGLMSGDSGMYMGMTLSVLCGEEVSKVTPEEALESAGDSFAGDSYYQFWSLSCTVWDYFTIGSGLPEDIDDPIGGDVPALALSGDLDPVTPPSLGEQWVQTFPNGRHIVVQGNGHITSRTGCMPSKISQFLDTLDAKAIDFSCLDHLERLPVVTGINGQVQ